MYENTIKSNSGLLAQVLEDKPKSTAAAESFNWLEEVCQKAKTLNQEEKKEVKNKLQQKLENVEGKIKEAPRFSEEKFELQKTKKKIQEVLYFLK